MTITSLDPDPGQAPNVFGVPSVLVGASPLLSPVPAPASPALPLSEPTVAAIPLRHGRTCKDCGRRIDGLLPVREVVRRLGISMSAFNRNYSEYFTDRRPVKLQHVGAMRLVPEDEVDLFVSHGAEAVVDYRRRKGRLSLEQARLLVEALKGGRA